MASFYLVKIRNYYPAVLIVQVNVVCCDIATQRYHDEHIHSPISSQASFPSDAIPQSSPPSLIAYLIFLPFKNSFLEIFLYALLFTVFKNLAPE